MADAKGVRFAMWLMPGLGDDPVGDIRHLAPDMMTWHGGLLACVNERELDIWKRSLGTLEWDSLVQSKRRLVMAWAPDGSPGAADGALHGRINTARLALMLASDHCRHWGESQIITGRAATIEPVAFCTTWAAMALETRVGRTPSRA